MKRKIGLIVDNGRERVEIRAMIKARRPYVRNENGRRERQGLSRDEVGVIRDTLADDLMRAVAKIPYASFALSRIRVT